MWLSNKIENLYLWGIKTPIFLLPFISLYVSPSMAFPFITGKNIAFRIIVEFLAVLWFGLYSLNNKYRLRNSPLTLFVLIFTFIVGIANLFGVNPYNSFWSNFERMEGYITILHLTLYFMIIKTILRDERDWKIFFNIFVIVGFLVSLFAFILPPSSSMSSEFASEYNFRVYSTIGNPPFLASYLLLSVFLGIILLFKTQNKYYRYFYLLPIILNFIAIYLTASRGALLATIIGLVLCSLFVLHIKTNKNKKIKFYKVVITYIIIIFIFIVAFMVFSNSDFVKNDRTLSRFTSIKSDISVKTRINTWKMAWNGIRERPILGWGQENYKGIFTVNPIPNFNGLVWVDRAHNIIIDWLISAGILGFFSYLLILGYALFIIWTLYYHKKRITKAIFITLFTALVVYFIQNFFTFDTINTYLIFFALLAFISNINENNDVISSEQRADTIKKNKIVKSLCLTFLSILLFLFFVYYINYKPIKATQLTVRISRDFPHYKSFTKLRNDFQDALSYETFANTDIKLRMAEVSSQIIKHKLFEFEGALNFILWTIEELKKGIEDNHHNLDYLSQMIMLYSKVARNNPSFIAETEKLIKSAMQINPEYEWLYYKLADVNLYKRDYENAFKIINKVVDHDALNEKKQFKLAEVAILASRGEVADRALENVRKIRMVKNTEISSGRKQIFSVSELYFIATKYAEIKNYEEALEYYKEIITILPRKAKYHYELAEIYLQLGDNINAKMEINKAAELNPH
jgi:oligosaccharide repeat unit polymerase